MNLKSLPFTEVDVGKATIAYFRDTMPGCEVYQEVKCSGVRFDLVVCFGRLRIGVELKKTPNLTVLEQSWRSQPYFHYRYVCTESPKTISRQLWERMCGMIGAGVFYYHSGTNNVQLASYSPKPWYNRCPVALALYEEQKTWADAGSPTQGVTFFSPFRKTVRALTLYVRAHPGCTLKEAIDSISHHYQCDSTARNCLASYIQQDVIQEVQLDCTHRPFRLYLQEETDAT